MSDSVYEADNLNLTDSDIVRIEENVPFHWSGVTGCNNHDRAQNEYKKTLTNWVKNKMYEHRNWRWIRYSATEAIGRCTQYRDRWTGKRSCLCRGSLKCYIEFRRP